MSFWSRIRNVFRGEAVSREIEEEIAAHAEESGRSLRGTLRYAEQSRDIKMLPWFDSLRADLIFGWRQLKKNRSVSIAAVLSLALGIGACTAAFQLIDAVLLRSLPVSEPDRLFYIGYRYIDRNGKADISDDFSYPLYRELRDAVKDRAELMVISYAPRVDLTFGSDAEMEKAYRQYISGNALAALGVRPAIGRILTPSDDLKPGAHPVAVISHDYWMRRFGGDRNVLGKTFRRGDGQQCEIVGVLERGFTGTDTGTVTGIFLPAMMNAESINNADRSWFRTWVKLKPDVTVEGIRPALQAVFTNHRRERAKGASPTWTKQRIESFVNAPIDILPAASGVSGAQKNYRRPLMILGVVVGLVLLIACTNVANLLAAQAAARAREMALRVSIGAGRWRLLQLMLVEGALLTVAATVLGALFAWWSAPFVVAKLNPPDNPIRLVLDWDWRVLAFGATLAAFVTLLFGLAPALRASAVKPISALKGGDDPHARQRLMNSLIAAQVAFCFLVHFVAGLFVATFDRLSHQPVGFTPEGLLLLDTTANTGNQPTEIWRQIADQLRGTNNVESVAFCSFPLMGGNTRSTDIRVGNRPPEDHNPYSLGISQGWLETMRIGLIDGRDFRPEEVHAHIDKQKQPHDGVAIVNEEFARHYFNGENPVGKSFEKIDRDNKLVRVAIVGYARDARYRNMREPIRPTVYVPFSPSAGATFVVRVRPGTDLLSLAIPLRREVSRIRSEFRVSNVWTQMELVQSHTIRERLLAMLSLFFAIVALILAGVGLYGVLNYSVTQRTREIGIRMALGARPANVVRRVTTEVFAMLALGAVIGLTAGLISERYIESLLFGVKATDLPMLAIPASALLAAALLAALAPTIRAVRIDPAQALRAE